MPLMNLDGVGVDRVAARVGGEADAEPHVVLVDDQHSVHVAIGKSRRSPVRRPLW